MQEFKEGTPRTHTTADESATRRDMRLERPIDKTAGIFRDLSSTTRQGIEANNADKIQAKTPKTQTGESATRKGTHMDAFFHPNPRIQTEARVRLAEERKEIGALKNPTDKVV